jgi:hypothetical protein
MTRKALEDKQTNFANFLTGQSSVEFDLLDKELEAFIREEQIFWGKERKSAERETRLSTCHQLFCALYYLRQNPPFDLLAFLFDVSPGLIHAYVRKILGIMDAHFEQKKK